MKPWVAVAAMVLATAAAAQTPISFATPDGGVVHAEEYGAGPRGVVLAHGGRFTKESWRAQAPVFAAAGFRVLAIDFRGRGQSHGPATARGEDGVEFDVIGAVQYLRAGGATSVDVVGGSFGGWAAAKAAVAAPGAIDRLVLLATTVDDPERLDGRKLFIIARGDTTARGVPRLVAIREQFERTPDPKELVVLDGTAHAQFLFETDQGDRLLHEIVRFLSAP